MTEQIKYCPFCGSEGEIGQHSMNIGDSLNKNIFTRFFITCKNCLIETQYFEKQIDAINFWNRRVRCMEC